MKAGIYVISTLIILVLATAGCVQSPPGGNVTQPATTTTTAPPTTMATIPPTMATTVPVTATIVTTLPTTVAGGGSFVFNSIGDHRVGEKFTISGTTNLAPGNQLLVEIVSTSFGPTNKSASGQFYGTSGIVNVTRGVVEERNRWAFDVDTTGWVPDLYQVTVSGVTVNVRGSSSFRLLPAV
jgi:hypothetical protein